MAHPRESLILFASPEFTYSGDGFLHLAATLCLEAAEGYEFNLMTIISSIHTSTDPRPHFTFRLYSTGDNTPLTINHPIETQPYWLRLKYSRRSASTSQTLHRPMGPRENQAAELYRSLVRLDHELVEDRPLARQRAEDTGECGQAVDLT